MFCANCGGAVGAEERFCGQCGAPMPAPEQTPAALVTETAPTQAPPPPPPPPTAQVPPPPPRAGGAGLSVPPVLATTAKRVATEVLAHDWAGPIRVAGATLGTAAVLAILIGIGMRPAIPGAHWSLHTTLAFLSFLWAGAFGPDITAHASVAKISASVGIGTFPFTITLVAYAVGGWFFWRYTRRLASVVSVAGFIARTALLTAIPPLIVSWVMRVSLSELLHLAGVRTPGDMNLNVANLHVGFSSMGSFFLTLIFTALVFAGVTVLRADLFTGKAEKARGFLVGPVTGFGAFVAALLPAGLVGAVFVWLFRTSGLGSGLTWHEWMNIVAAVIAYAPNIGLWMVSLGSLGQVGGSASTNLGSVDVSASRGLHFWASSDTGIDHGVWVSVVLAPLVIAVAAYAVVWAARNVDARTQLKRLVSWVVSLLVVLPFLLHFMSVHGHASASGAKGALLGGIDSVGGILGGDLPLLGGIGDFGNGLGKGIPDPISGHASGGPTASSVVLIALYALVVALVIAFLRGLLTRDSIDRLRARLDYQGASRQGSGSAEGTATGLDSTTVRPTVYQVGDVVNGWRWDGQSWVPAGE